MVQSRIDTGSGYGERGIGLDNKRSTYSLPDCLLGVLVSLLGGVLHLLLRRLDGIRAKPVSLALIHFRKQTVELRTNIDAVEPANSGIDVVDEEAVSVLETLHNSRMHLVHVKGIRDRGRVQAVLIGLVDIGRDIALVDVVVRLDSPVERVDVRLHVVLVVEVSLFEVRVELLTSTFQRATTSRIDALLPQQTPALVGLAVDGTRLFLGSLDPGRDGDDDRASVRLCLLLCQVVVRLDDGDKLVVRLCQIAADGTSIFGRVVERKGTRRARPERSVDEVEDGDATGKRDEPASETSRLFAFGSLFVASELAGLVVVDWESNGRCGDGGAAAGPRPDVALSSHGESCLRV